MKRLTKHKQELLNFLGPKYSFKMMDGEPCIYRNLKTHDVEISGGHQKNEPITIFFWQIENGIRMIKMTKIEPNNFQKVSETIERFIRDLKSGKIEPKQ